MPIVSSTHTFTTQADGSTSNVVRMFDQDGKDYVQVFYAPEGFNVQSKIDLMIVGLNEQLAEQEFQALVGL